MNEWAITTEGLGKRFGRVWAVRDLDLRVPHGAVCGLLGPNGAGKSTTIQMLLGVLPPTTGRAQVLGMDPAREDVAVRRRVGYVAEVHGFYEWMTVDRLIALVATYHVRWDWDLARTLQSEFGLNGTSRIRILSKGMRARLALLLALAFHPDLLILDEPTGGLDPAARRSFIESILGRFQEQGKTILVASHLLNEFSGLLDHVVFLKESRLVYSSSIVELNQRFKRASLLFDGPAPEELTVPGALAIRRNGRQARITLRDFDAERTPRQLAQLGARQIDICDLPLDDLFIDLVG